MFSTLLLIMSINRKPGYETTRLLEQIKNESNEKSSRRTNAYNLQMKNGIPICFFPTLNSIKDQCIQVYPQKLDISVFCQWWSCVKTNNRSGTLWSCVHHYSSPKTKKQIIILIRNNEGMKEQMGGVPRTSSYPSVA